MVSLAEWLAAFRDQHERARRGVLTPSEEQAYRAGRDELAKTLLLGQRLTLQAGQTPRQALRVARALQIELTLPTLTVKAITLDLSTGGFSTALAAAPPLGDELGVTLRLPATGGLSCRARITDVRPHGSQHRVAARFLQLAEQDRERLEIFVFDMVLAQLGR